MAVEYNVGKRQRLLELAEAGGLTRSLRFLHDRGAAFFLILAYHRVVAVEDFHPYSMDPELISATPDEFRWQMGFLRDRANLVSLNQVIDALNGQEPLPPRAIAITFDDGYNDTYSHAFPVLKEYQIPATVFATTGSFDSGEPFWFEFVAHLMMSLPPRTLTVRQDDQRLPAGPSHTHRRESLKQLHALLKFMPNDARSRLMNEWRLLYAPAMDSVTRKLLSPMNWAQVREMHAAGIHFGAHTVTHPNLMMLSDEDLASELQDCKHTLELQTGAPVRSLAYPIGTPNTYDQRVIDAARSAGFLLGLSYRPGVNWMSRVEPFDMRRHGIHASTSRSAFRALIDIPAWLA